MLVWHSFHNFDAFHESIFKASPNPTGRAAPSDDGQPEWATQRLVTGHRTAMGLRSFILFAFVLFATISLRPIFDAGATLTGLLLLFAAGCFVTICFLDYIFWHVRRAHDLGRGAVYALTPYGLIGLAAIATTGLFIATPWHIAVQLFGAACLVTFVAIPSCAWLVSLHTRQGDAGPNRFGPPPAPIPPPEDFDL